MNKEQKISGRHYKIVYVVSDTAFGGGTRYFSSLVSGLDKEKYEFGVACHAGTPLEKHFIEEGIRVYPFPVRSRFDIKGMIRFARMIAKEGIDCLLLGDGAAWNCGLFLKVLSSVPHLWAIVHMTHVGLEIREYGMFERVLSRLYDFTWTLGCERIIVSNNKNAGILASEGVAEKKLHIIPNCIDFQSFAEKRYSRQNELKKQYGIGSETKIIGMVARLGAGKDFDTLFSAIGEVRDTLPECVFMLVGTGPLREELEVKSNSLGLGNHVIFTGWVEDAFEYVDLFDIFVFSSVAEGIPYSILEATAFGKPIVSTNNGAISEVIYNDKTGMLVPARDHKALAERLLELLRNTEKAHLLGKNAQKLVEEKYNLPIMLRQFDELFTKWIGHET